MRMGRLAGIFFLIVYIVYKKKQRKKEEGNVRIYSGISYNYIGIGIPWELAVLAVGIFSGVGSVSSPMNAFVICA